MAINHKISSNGYGGYHGAVKAKELSSQKQHEHGNMRAGLGEEGSKPGPQVRNGSDRNFKPLSGNGGSSQPRDKIGESGHRHGEIDKHGHGHSRNFDSYVSGKHNSHRQDTGHFSYGKQQNGLSGMHGTFQGTMRIYQFSQITVTHSSVFSGVHLGSLDKRNEAHKDFVNAALGFLKNPSEKAYKSLNDAMIKLMDPKFAPAITGGAAKVSVYDVNGKTMAKFTMEVTPAPTKTLEEAREDLKNAYSSKRNGEKDIAGIRKEAYENYIRALSEQFKKDGKISHTNDTPTTPVFKSSVIYIAKVTQINVTGFHEIKKPNFGHNLHGKLIFKNQQGSWNDYRQNHKSYVDMLKHDSKKSHIDKDSKSRKAIELKHDNRHSDGVKAGGSGNRHHNKARTDKVS